MNVCIIERVQLKIPSHRLLDDAAATIMLDRVFRGGAATEETYIGGTLSALPSSVSIPPVPNCAEDCGPNPWCCEWIQYFKHMGNPACLPVGRKVLSRAVGREINNSSIG